MSELRARAAAAAVALRHGGAFIASLEARLPRQADTGSHIVVGLLQELGVCPESLVVEAWTRSTREEVMGAARLVEEQGLERLVAITSVYHVPRVRAYLSDHLPRGRFSVHSPECYYRQATPRERTWIEGGAPTAQTLHVEGRVERGCHLLRRALQALPEPVRYDVEIQLVRTWAALGVGVDPPPLGGWPFRPPAAD